MAEETTEIANDSAVSGSRQERLVMLREHGPLSTNQIIIGEYRLFGKINKRLNVQVWLSRMIKNGKVRRVGRGLYDAT